MKGKKVEAQSYISVQRNQFVERYLPSWEHWLELMQKSIAQLNSHWLSSTDRDIKIDDLKLDMTGWMLGGMYLRKADIHGSEGRLEIGWVKRDQMGQRSAPLFVESASLPFLFVADKARHDRFDLMQDCHGFNDALTEDDRALIGHLLERLHFSMMGVCMLATKSFQHMHLQTLEENSGNKIRKIYE